MKWVDLAFKVLSALVIPVLLWAISLQVGNAVQNEKIARLEAEVASTKTLKDSIASQNVALGRVEVKIDEANKRLDEIRTDFRRSLPPDRM